MLTNPVTLAAYSLVTTSQKYVFNVHHITTSGGKFNIFVWRGHGKSRPKFTKTRYFK